MSGAISSRKRGIVALFAVAVLLYAVLFFVQERRNAHVEERLVSVRPAAYYRALSGYLHQLVAEMIFVRTNVFVGHATMLNRPLAADGQAIAYNLETSISLNPGFLAPYFLAQAFLPEISPELARSTNSILATGLKAHPNDIALHLSRAANFFLWLDDPLQASQAFAEAAKVPGAPPIFFRLSEMFATPEGELKAGLVSLMALRNTEKDPGVREKYRQQIANYERAVTVQNAVDAYERATGSAPTTLEQLLPTYLPVIPVFDQGYQIRYDPPYVRLLRTQSRQTEQRN